MSSGNDQRMVEEFVAGREVPDIAARYNVPEAYVDRVIEQTHLDKPQRPGRGWSWKNWGNRIAYCVVVALGINLITGSWLGWVAGIILFALTSAIVSARR